jgi:hypothetical protein
MGYDLCDVIISLTNLLIWSGWLICFAGIGRIGLG